MLSSVDEALDPLSGDRPPPWRHQNLPTIYKDDLVADYPLLPTRRSSGRKPSANRQGRQGRRAPQLKMVHDAAESVVDKPLGRDRRRLHLRRVSRNAADRSASQGSRRTHPAAG